MEHNNRLQYTMRWFGPHDPVPLSHIRQAGCSGVVTALHHIPVGEIWTIEEINQRKSLVQAAGMEWKVIESLPVHEDIKKRDGNHLKYIANYQQSLRNVARCGLKVVTYNFMPILDWIRTDISYVMPDGSKALRFEKSAFIAFDVYMLQRPGAENDYTKEELQKAHRLYLHMDDAQKKKLFHNALLGLPGSEEPFTKSEILEALKTYQHIDTAQLKQHLYAFLHEIMPVAEECGLQMAVHPDDPPYPVLGLPRIVSTAQDLEDLINAYPSPANGLCFCTGSLGVRKDNDLLEMMRRWDGHIHFLHLRSTTGNKDGNFYEADHLNGDMDMYDIMREAVELMHRKGIALPMRPDHGHQMLDDLHKTTYPGYSAIGRLRGLAELRGLEMAIQRSMENRKK